MFILLNCLSFTAAKKLCVGSHYDMNFSALKLRNWLRIWQLVILQSKSVWNVMDVSKKANKMLDYKEKLSPQVIRDSPFLTFWWNYIWNLLFSFVCNCLGKDIDLLEKVHIGYYNDYFRCRVYEEILLNMCSLEMRRTRGNSI